MARPRELERDSSLQADIVKLIEAGAYDFVAAEACGITDRTFYNWMRWGSEEAAYLREHQTPRPERAVYLDFYHAITRARARARVAAEMEVRYKDPKFWLKNGPGRTKPGRPGWTDTLSVVGSEGGDPINLVMLGDLSDEERLTRIEEIFTRARDRLAEQARPPSDDELGPEDGEGEVDG